MPSSWYVLASSCALRAFNCSDVRLPSLKHLLEAIAVELVPVVHLALWEGDHVRLQVINDLFLLLKLSIAADGGAETIGVLHHQPGDPFYFLCWCHPVDLQDLVQDALNPQSQFPVLFYCFCFISVHLLSPSESEKQWACRPGGLLCLLPGTW